MPKTRTVTISDFHYTIIMTKRIQYNGIFKRNKLFYSIIIFHTQSTVDCIIQTYTWLLH